MTMTLRHMRYFDALATTMHFTKAAELARISQPALSAQIADLEAIVGAQLVERSKSGVKMTEKGSEMLVKFREILQQVKLLEDSAKPARSVLSGKIAIGAIPTVAPYLIPKLIPLLRQEYADLDIELREAVTSTLIDELAFGRIDVMIAALPVANAAFEFEALFTDRFLVAVADNDRDVLHGPVVQENFAPERLLLLEEGHCLRDQALDVCGTGSRRLVNFGATSLSTLLQLVSNGLGMTLIPEIAVDVERQRNAMRIVRFDEPQPSRTIGMIWRKSSTSKSDIKTLGELIRRVHVQSVLN